MLKGKIEAIFWSVFEFKHSIFILAPVLFPRLASRTDTAGCGRDIRDSELVFGGHERMKAVVEVGEKQNRSSREGLHQRGLVDAVERARLDLADSTRGE